MKKLIRLLPMLLTAGFILSSCEGPRGIAGENGQNGQNGVDANESCKECHNQTVIEAKNFQFEHSVHFNGTAFEEGTRTSCAPCHSHQGFLSVVQNNTPATFTVSTTDPTKYVNNYSVSAATASLPAPINCFTCHDSLHTTYTYEDFRPLTNEAPVAMTMWGGTKTIDFAKKEGNLCAKCHQPRPVTAGSGNVIDYAKLISEPTTPFTLASVSYRTGIHYGAQGAMARGVGAVEFGSGYTSDHPHATQASCASCHMATPEGMAGGHSFEVAGNFNGCNTCHETMSATNSLFTTTTSDVDGLIADLATKINAIGAGHDILQKDSVDNQYHGYIDIWDANSNPTGYWKNPDFGTPAFPALTNAQFGAIINFQLAVRDGSHGIHNPAYIKKVLENTIAAI